MWPTLTTHPWYVVQNKKNLFGLKKFYDQKQKTQIMVNEQCKAMHDSA